MTMPSSAAMISKRCDLPRARVSASRYFPSGWSSRMSARAHWSLSALAARSGVADLSASGSCVRWPNLRLGCRCCLRHCVRPPVVCSCERSAMVACEWQFQPAAEGDLGSLQFGLSRKAILVRSRLEPTLVPTRFEVFNSRNLRAEYDGSIFQPLGLSSPMFSVPVRQPGPNG